MTETPPSFPHLSKSAARQALLTDDERIRIIRSGTWIELDHAKDAIEKLDGLLSYPTVTRMPSYLLVGPSFSGKTSILEHFIKKHPPEVDPEAEVSQYPVLMVDAPPKPDLSDFYSSILDAMVVAYKPTASTAQKRSQIKVLFHQLGVKVLVIDEIHHLIAGSLNRQREFRNALKSLSNETKVCLVASGIEEAYNAFNADPQLSSRFMPIDMPRWMPGKKLGTLLATLEHRTPLRKPSVLHAEDLMLAIHSRSEGTLGDICDLVKEAAVAAIRSGEECITGELLADLDWAPPSKRKMYRRSV